jgi:flagellar hook-length control protein FliK
MNIAPHDPLPRTSSIIDLLAPSQGGVVATGSQFAGFDSLLSEPQTVGPIPAGNAPDNSHSSSTSSEQPPDASSTETTSTSDKLVQEDKNQLPPDSANSPKAAAESQDDADEEEESDETSPSSAVQAVLVVPHVDLPVATPPALAADEEIAITDEQALLTDDADVPAERLVAAAEPEFPPAPPASNSQTAPTEAAGASIQSTEVSAEEALAAGLVTIPERPADESEARVQIPESEAISLTAGEAHVPEVVDEQSAAEDRPSRRRSSDSPSTREDAGQSARPSAGPLLEPLAAPAIAEPVTPTVSTYATEGSLPAGGGERNSASTAVLTANTASPASTAPWRLPAEMISAGPSRSTREISGPPIDTQRILTRVARAFVMAQDGGGELRLRLSPAELGSLRLEVRVQEGVLQARVEAETPAARTVLIENLPALRERLAEQGVRIERFDVDLMQHSPGGTPDHSRQQSEPQNIPRPASSERIRTWPQVAEGVAPRTVMAHDLDARRLNIVV